MTRSFLFLALLFVVSSCDSGDAVDPPSPADVAGVYDVTELTFTPRPTALDAIDVTASVEGGTTLVELLDGGQATLRFRRIGGTTRLVPGTVDVRRRQLQLTFASGNDAALQRLLLPQVLTFDRDGDQLTATVVDRTVNLESYDSDRYAGFQSVQGTLTVQLDLRDQ